MHINQLSDLSFRFIFRNIPNRHLQIASSVCPKWTQFSAEKARHRQALTLFIGREEDLNMFPILSNGHRKGCLQREIHLTNETFVTLPGFFLNVTKVTVYITRPLYLPNLSQLLASWKSSLFRLEIRAYREKRPAEEQTEELAAMRVHLLGILHSINSLTSLVDLEFHTNFCLLAPTETSFDLPIFTRLKALSWDTPDGADSLVVWLLKYSLTNSPLRWLKIGSIFRDPTRLNELQSDFFMTRLKTIQIKLMPGFGHLTELPSFTSLISLQIITNDYPLGRNELTRYLGPLTQLKRLGMLIKTDTLEAWSEEEMPGRFIVPSSVEVLALAMPTPLRSHSLIGRLQLHRFFPKLKALFLRNLNTLGQMCTECTESSCEYKWIYGLPDDGQFCENQILRSLSQYTNLRLIFG